MGLIASFLPSFLLLFPSSLYSSQRSKLNPQLDDLHFSPSPSDVTSFSYSQICFRPALIIFGWSFDQLHLASRIHYIYTHKTATTADTSIHTLAILAWRLSDSRYISQDASQEDSGGQSAYFLPLTRVCWVPKFPSTPGRSGRPPPFLRWLMDMSILIL